MSDSDRLWQEVIAELEHQLRVPEDWQFDVESRSRATVHCQRLLRDHWVALAVPARGEPRPESADPSGDLVVAFTDAGPWLFTASGGNPGLPGQVIGPVPDASPITFGPHERDGGVLTIGGRRFVVPYLYGSKVRELVEQLAALDPPADDSEE